MRDTDEAKLTRAAAASVVAELLYARPGSEGLGAAVVTPLVDDGRIVVALPYADRQLADALAAAEEVALVLSDDRMALRGWEPLTVTGRIEVEPDPDGDRFRDRLLDQELRKYPPSRLLVDSLRDRRDHWWYLPRLVCRLHLTGAVRALTPRTTPTSGVLGWRSPAGLEAEVVEVVDADEDRMELRAGSGREMRGAGEPALLLRHDYSQPDLERRSERRESGRLNGSVLTQVTREGELALPDPPGLLTRFRRFRSLAKACREGLERDR